MVAAVVILVVPLVVFTAIDRGWIGGDDGPLLGPRDVHVQLSNFDVDLSRDEITAGEVHLLVEHEEERAHRGDQPGESHDVVVLRELEGGRAEVIDRTEQLHAGDTQWLVMELGPGEYTLLCSVVEDVQGEVVSHDGEGMRTTLRVVAASEAEGEARHVPRLSSALN
jgi:hypothetical protein